MSPSKTTPAAWSPGSIFAGKYRIAEVIGQGGYGYVLAAEHIELREPRAIKVLRPEASRDREAVERFLREARLAARLRTEHVVAIHDAGRLDGGEPYLVMEHLQGTDLSATLRARGPLPVPEAVDYVLQALEALAEAHASGIVHRDLKPSNLFLTSDARGRTSVKLLDFGISKVFGSSTVLTASDAVFGTPQYMPPEQLRATGSVDARSDIWAMGIILNVLVTGEHPFPSKSIGDLCVAVLHDQPLPASSRVPAVPVELDAVIARCLEKDAGRRYASVHELAAALSSFAPATPQVTPPVALAQTPDDALTRHANGAGRAPQWPASREHVGAAVAPVPAPFTASVSPESVGPVVPSAALATRQKRTARTAAIVGAVVAALGAGAAVLVIALGAKSTPPAVATSSATTTAVVAGSAAPNATAAAVASPASSEPLPRLLPIDYPRVPTTAVAGQKAFGLNRQQLDRSLADAAAGKYYVAAQFLPVTVLEPGAEQSLVQHGGDKYLLPNAVILPIRRGERSAVGDIIVAGWVWTVGIVVGGSETDPVFRTLAGELGSSVESLYTKDETAEPDTFIKLRGVIEPGQPVAARDGADYKLVRVIHARDDLVLTTEATGGLSVYPRKDCLPMPLDPRVAPGDSLWVPFVSGFVRAKVVSVDARLGRVWAERSGEKRGYGFTNVIASLSGP